MLVLKPVENLHNWIIGFSVQSNFKLTFSQFNNINKSVLRTVMGNLPI